MSDQQPQIYEIIDLESAKEFLKNHREPVIITNSPDSVRYYGVRVLKFMFKELAKEFPQVVKVVVNVSDDNAALFTAMKLGLKNINYSGESEEAKMILKKFGIV